MMRRPQSANLLKWPGSLEEVYEDISESPTASANRPRPWRSVARATRPTPCQPTTRRIQTSEILRLSRARRGAKADCEESNPGARPHPAGAADEARPLRPDDS